MRHALLLLVALLAVRPAGAIVPEDLCGPLSTPAVCVIDGDHGPIDESILTLDFGARDVRMKRQVEISLAEAVSFTMKAHAFVLEPGAKILGPAVDVELDATAGIDLQVDRSTQAQIDVRGDAESGTITLYAGGDIVVAGKLDARGDVADVEVTSTGGKVTISGEVLTNGVPDPDFPGDRLDGGDVTVTSQGPIEFSGSLDASGATSGDVELSSKATLTVAAGSELVAEGDGDGENLLKARGAMTVAGRLSAGGANKLRYCIQPPTTVGAVFNPAADIAQDQSLCPTTTTTSTTTPTSTTTSTTMPSTTSTTSAVPTTSSSTTTTTSTAPVPTTTSTSTTSTTNAVPTTSSSTTTTASTAPVPTTTSTSSTTTTAPCDCGSAGGGLLDACPTGEACDGCHCEPTTTSTTSTTSSTTTSTTVPAPTTSTLAPVVTTTSTAPPPTTPPTTTPPPVCGPPDCVCPRPPATGAQQVSCRLDAMGLALDGASTTNIRPAVARGVRTRIRKIRTQVGLSQGGGRKGLGAAKRAARQIGTLASYVQRSAAKRFIDEPLAARLVPAVQAARSEAGALIP